jgi:heterotetrameric sarcosine oxidase delta subunit
MMRIPCRFCGLRDETEFTFGGEAHITRPPLSCTDVEWVAYLHYRANPKGSHREQWFHARGCRRWFNVVRDTVSHEVFETYEMGSAPPEARR